MLFRSEMQVMVDKSQMASTIKVLHKALIEDAQDDAAAPVQSAMAAG